MTTPQREAFGGGHESAHWSPHLWDSFRSTRRHVDRMWRAFGIAAKTTTAAAVPPSIEYSNPEPDPVPSGADPAGPDPEADRSPYPSRDQREQWAHDRAAPYAELEPGS